MNSHLKKLHSSIVSSGHKYIDKGMLIPDLWIPDSYTPPDEKPDCSHLKRKPFEFETVVNPGHYFSSVISEILSVKHSAVVGRTDFNFPGDWITASTIYGIFPRQFTSWFHCGGETLGGSQEDITLNEFGIRETGSFLKCIALLPYIKSLGIDTLYMLPISLTGVCFRKGELGSPYAVKNPYIIDPDLADPLSDLSAEDQFKALVQACHSLGIRVVLDFVLRTCSRDSDFIPRHPDWFYWIKKEQLKNYHSPEFTKAELEVLYKQVDDPDISEYLEPHIKYRSIFCTPPDEKGIQFDDQDGYTGKINADQQVSIPGAFADWPPDDIQPPWDDVTYFKLFSDREFNYIAYNTIRMYDCRISERNTSLWTELQKVIPYYIDNYKINGARIDMGHSLPYNLEQNIIMAARQHDNDFALISENFNPFWKARSHGYNIVWGNAWWQWCRIKDFEDKKPVNRFKRFIMDIPDYPDYVIGTADTFDTPRACTRDGHAAFSRLATTLSAFLPECTTMIQSGFEFHQPFPSNLGLDFTADEIADNKNPLALFSRANLTWKTDTDSSFIEYLRKILSLRKQFIDIIKLHSGISFKILEYRNRPLCCKQSHEPLFAYMRYDTGFAKCLIVACNFDFENPQKSVLIVPQEFSFASDWHDLINGDFLCKSFLNKNGNTEIELEFNPGEVKLLFSERKA